MKLDMVADLEVDMVADNVADMEVDIVADMEVDKVAGLTSTLRPTIGIDIDIHIHININMEIQFGERVGHVGWFTGPKLFRLKAYPLSLS